jgi:hypothetical protein
MHISTNDTMTLIIVPPGHPAGPEVLTAGCSTPESEVIVEVSRSCIGFYFLGNHLIS